MLFFIAFFACINAIAQTQIGIIKSPQWNLIASYDSKFGNTLELSNNSLAMIVGIPKEDFAILSLDHKLAQNWLTPLAGYPLTIGKFKSKILVIAASDRSFLKSFSGSYKAYLLDEKTGKVLSEKIIYDGNKDYIEEPDFYFAKDGSYFRMSIRLTSMKRKATIFAVSKSDKLYRTTQNFSIINYDADLNQKETVEPRMPEGDSWTISNGTDGSFFIATVDNKNAKVNIATYISSGADPLKVISIPIDVRKGGEIRSFKCIAGTKPFISYLAVVYENTAKEISLLISRLDFKDGSSKLSKEVFDSKHVKELQRSFVPVNNKLDDLQFTKIDFLGVKNLAEYGDKIMVSVAAAYVESSKYGTITFEGSLLMNIYDQELKGLYHQFIPRTYMSLDGEGSDIAYTLKNNTLRMIANVRSGSLSSVSSWYGEMDFVSGKMLKFTKVPDKEIKGGFYVHTPAVTWLDQSFILPYFDKQRIFRTTLDAQMQLLSY